MTFHKITAVRKNKPFLHYLFILPNLIYDTGSQYRPQLPHLSLDRQVTDTQPCMAHPVFILLCLLLMLPPFLVRFYIWVKSVHVVVPHRTVALNWFMCFIKKLKVYPARKNAPVTWNQRTKKWEQRGAFTKAPCHCYQDTGKEQGKVFGQEDRQLKLMWACMWKACA